MNSQNGSHLFDPTWPVYYFAFVPRRISPSSSRNSDFLPMLRNPGTSSPQPRLSSLGSRPFGDAWRLRRAGSFGPASRQSPLPTGLTAIREQPIRRPMGWRGPDSLSGTEFRSTDPVGGHNRLSGPDLRVRSSRRHASLKKVYAASLCLALTKRKDRLFYKTRRRREPKSLHDASERGTLLPAR